MRGKAIICFGCLIICFALCWVSCKRWPLEQKKRMISPLQFGLNEAKTGADCYYVLQRTHNEAYRLGVGVSYSGVKELFLEIPKDAQSLPLTSFTDFAGVSLIVKNTQKDFFLFSMSNKVTSVDLNGEEIDGRDFTINPVMKSGKKLLVIKDKTPWVENRIGYNYGATRKDVMLVENGRGGNATVQSYCTSASSPECYYCEVNPYPKIVKNIVFQRAGGSTKKTYLIMAENQYNVKLSNVDITTPDGSGLYGDKAIYMLNCVDVTLDGISINGTYSLPKRFGYGVSLDNIYNLQVKNMYARANWGVFGNNNVNKAMLQDCDINRFDIHCYGKDVSFENCSFVDFYNQFSSMYGLISFKRCTFTRFTPVLIEGTYNAHTGFDIVFEDCTFNLDKDHTSIFSIFGMSKIENSRPELKERCLPNISMLECRVNVPNGVEKWSIYNTSKMNGYDGAFSYISKVIVKRLSTNAKPETMNVFSKYVNTKNEVRIVIA